MDAKPPGKMTPLPLIDSQVTTSWPEEAYAELRRLARRYMANERRNHTLQPTALANEAFVRLSRIEGFEWRSRAEFLAAAATQMRRILIEYARSSGTRKRGGGMQRVSLYDHVALTPERSIELLALDEAIQRLHLRSPRQARVAEMRLFAGLEVIEISAVLGVTGRTVKRDWRVARAWLACELRERA